MLVESPSSTSSGDSATEAKPSTDPGIVTAAEKDHHALVAADPVDDPATWINQHAQAGLLIWAKQKGSPVRPGAVLHLTCV